MTKDNKKPDWIFNRAETNRGIQRKLADGINARIFSGDNVMLSFVQVESYSTGNIHSHPEEQWGIVLEGECICIQGDERIQVREGDFWHTPGDVLHGIKTESHKALVLDIFNPPRKTYLEVGEGFSS